MRKSIDMGMINEIRELETDAHPDLVSSILKLFLDSMPARVERIKSAIDSGRSDLLQKEAHSFKSSAGNIGANELSLICATLEGLGKSERLEGAAELFAQLRAEILEVQMELHRLPELNKLD